MNSLFEKDANMMRGYIAPTMRFCFRDLFLVIVFMLVGLIPLGVMAGTRSLREDGVKEAVLTVAGAEVWRYRMEDGADPAEYVAYFEGQKIKVSADSTGARVIQSDCPDQICVHSGSISEVGQTIVCVPLRAVLRIESGQSSDARATDDIGFIDAVAG